jgi:hypothetical protein
MAQYVNGDTHVRLLPVAGTLASLAIDGPAAATFNTVIEAVPPAYEGPVGGTITLTTVADGTWVPNIGTLTLAGNAVDAETVTIGSTVYRWKDTLAQAYDVKIGANAAASIVNLVAAINANGTPGTHYFAGTLVHPTVRAYDGAGDTVVVHTKSNTTLTAVGTLIATTETMTSGSWGATTLADGTDGTNVTFAVVGTAITCHFAPTYSTVSDFEAALAADATVSALIRVKTAGTTPLYNLVTPGDVFSATALTGSGATTSAQPSSFTDSSIAGAVALPFMADQGLLMVRSTAGSGTMTADLRLWGFNKATGRWHAIGKPNGGTALAEVGTDLLSHSELIVGLRRFTHLYCQIVSLGGTATEVVVSVDLIPCAAQST